MGTIWPFKKQEPQALEPASVPATLPDALPEPVPEVTPEVLPQLEPEPVPRPTPKPWSLRNPDLTPRPERSHKAVPVIDEDDGVIIGWSEPDDPSQIHPKRKRKISKAERHAAALLDMMGVDPVCCARKITDVAIQSKYRAWLLNVGEGPVPWQSLAAQLRKLAGTTEKRDQARGARRQAAPALLHPRPSHGPQALTPDASPPSPSPGRGSYPSPDAELTEGQKVGKMHAQFGE